MAWLWTPNPLLTSILFVLAVYCLIRERQTPAYWTWRRELATWKSTQRRARDARHALQARYWAMARCYWHASVWQYCLFNVRARRCRTAAALNRYVTLAEQHWSTKALP